MRAADPAALGAWYRDCLGLDADENGLWRQGAGLTVFATFESGTGYFGSRAQQTMLNFRVRDLDAMLAMGEPRQGSLGLCIYSPSGAPLMRSLSMFRGTARSDRRACQARI